METYADIAAAGFGDPVTMAERLRSAVPAFLDAPSAEGRAAAKAAWLTARVPSQQTEAFRFADPAADDREGRIEARPLDEGLIDFVDAAGFRPDGGLRRHPPGGPRRRRRPDADDLGRAGGRDQDPPAPLSDKLQEADGAETIVATGLQVI